MADIEVEHEGDDQYRVTVNERGGSTTRQVRVTGRDRSTPTVAGQRLSSCSRSPFDSRSNASPRNPSFRAFDLPVIGRHFLEYGNEIRRRLDE